MIKLNNKSNFKTFARLATLPGTEYSAIEDFIFFKATKLAYGQVLEALQDDRIYRIGLHACIGDESSLNSVARDVARECKGLPIAIQAVGRALKGQSIYEWQVALKNLKSSKPIDAEDGQRDAFSCLKLSFDNLKNENY
ncbi:hypothetical protein L6164_017134 [Bauhinia variegata]|uniref:Uncharacterized protein n=1 Tax=Bauhinia variegata TaxID=167791 RepID=A0ACB9N7Q7_BAUVA|nr:hypothetical protein L6164_017134 [Bauhinia variegata]